jgi:shikimate dehydrogenase
MDEPSLPQQSPVVASTRFLGVIGWPVAHSHSPAMQNAALAALGLDWVYGAFPVAPEALAQAVAGACALGFVGLNVTVPHKVAALRLCRPDALAERVGAVNTLVFPTEPGGETRGLNTDVHGFRRLIAEAGLFAEGGTRGHGRPLRAAILGAGGAARAVAVALGDEGVETHVVRRGAGRIELPGLELEHHDFAAAALAALLPTVDLLVDTTPRGLGPRPDNEGAAGHLPDLAPAPASALTSPEQEVRLLPRHALVVDLVVRRETPLVAAARTRGLRACTGAAMLLHQGAAALEAWTGRAAPLAVMRAALGRSIGGSEADILAS